MAGAAGSASGSVPLRRMLNCHTHVEKNEVIASLVSWPKKTANSHRDATTRVLNSGPHSYTQQQATTIRNDTHRKLPKRCSIYTSKKRRDHLVPVLRRRTDEGPFGPRTKKEKSDSGERGDGCV